MKITQATVFDRLQNATKKSFSLAGKFLGQQQDPELAIYERLKPENFKDILAKYGPDETMKYIKAMEAKKMKKAG